MAEAPSRNAVPSSAERPYEAEAGDPAADPSEASANESPKDLGKDYGRAHAPALNKRVDWGGGAYESGLTALMERPGSGTWGDEVKLKLNSHYVNLVRPKAKQEKLYQYNVSLLIPTTRPYHDVPACAHADYFTHRFALAMATKNVDL